MNKINSPLSIKTGRKKFILNLNQYRNTHYRVSNTAKKNYKEFMESQIKAIKKPLTRCCIIYEVFKGDRRDFDVGNIVAIQQKFFEDALVELGRIEDDSYKFIPICIPVYGGIDKDNPRVEIEIIPLNKNSNIKDIKNDIRKILNKY